jgi:hypothetical protein
MFMTSSRNRSQSPSASIPFSFRTEERAARRKEASSKTKNIFFFEEIIVLLWPIIFVVVKPSLIFVSSMLSEAGRKIQCLSGTKSAATSNTQGKIPHLAYREITWDICKKNKTCLFFV